MSWLLDTVTVSALRKNPDRDLVAWIAAQSPYRLFVSSITLLEIEIGVNRKERSDPRQGAVLRRWFEEQVVPEFAGRVLPFDERAAGVTAALHVPDPRPEYDTMIAGIAQAHGLTVVTRNVRDFEPLGVRVLNPWSA